MEIEVPAERKAKRQTVPPAGSHLATIGAATERDDGRAEVKWRFRAEKRQWTLPMVVAPADLGELLADLGFAGQTVDLPDIVGAKATIHVRTYGGRTSARVADVTPA